MSNIDINKVLRTNPFLALDIPNIEEIALKYLPYSIGMETECDNGPNFNLEFLKNIPDLINTNIDDYEKRFRIPNGIKGLCCLYNIAEELKVNCCLTSSGNHYHCDFSDKVFINGEFKTYFELINNHKFIEQNKEFILKELDKWEYPNTYNKRDMTTYKDSWASLRSNYNTIEFRIGEMSFDYEVLVNRVLHVSLLSSLLKDKAILFHNGTHSNIVAEEEEVQRVLNSRVINIYQNVEV